MGQCSTSFNGLLTEGKENQKIWPVPSLAGKLENMLFLKTPSQLKLIHKTYFVSVQVVCVSHRPALF